MARQLWHLALADFFEFFITGCCSLTRVYLGLSGSQWAESLWTDSLCYSCWGNELFAIPSILIEVHIALATVAAMTRCPYALRCLSQCLVLVWPVGAIVGSIVVFLDEVHFDQLENMCNTKTATGRRLKSIFLASALAICLTIYICCAVRVTLKSTAAAQHRVWNFAKYYILANIISWAPWSVFSFARQTELTQADQFTLLLVLALFYSDGFLHVAIYAAQSHFVRRMFSTWSPNGPTNQVTLQRPPVEFAECNSIHAIANICKEARNRSQKELTALEHQKHQAAVDFQADRAQAEAPLPMRNDRPLTPVDLDINHLFDHLTKANNTHHLPADTNPPADLEVAMNPGDASVEAPGRQQSWHHPQKSVLDDEGLLAMSWPMCRAQGLSKGVPGCLAWVGKAPSLDEAMDLVLGCFDSG